MLVEPIIIDILRNELELNNANVWVRDQNKKIPNDQGLYIVVGMVDTKVIGNNNTITPTDAGMTELQQVTMRQNIQIDIFSRSTDAITRRSEVLAALSSFYSQQLQERNSFKIFRIPTTFINSSGVEGGSNINRFSIIIACHTFFRKEKVLSSINGDYYDEFETRVDDANTIDQVDGLFEFTIIPEE